MPRNPSPGDRRPAARLCALAALTGLCLTGGLAEAAAPNPSRPVFVNLFEWRWADVARECETFLGPKGFGAVQVSPPNEHARISNNPWWERYQPVSYQLVSRSGSRADFHDMVLRCRAQGVEVYADVVINHMAAGSGTGIAGTAFSSRNFPGTWATWDFHWNAPPPDRCQAKITNYNDHWHVQHCELENLPDLRSETNAVRQKLADYLIDLYSEGVRGYRVDAAKHMWKDDIADILGKVDAGRVSGPNPYVVQEVIDPGGEAVGKSEYYQNGDVNEFLYGQKVGEKFFNLFGNISQLSTLGETWGLAPSNKAVVFIDNHDKQRGHGGGGTYVTFKNGWLYDLANVFMLAWPYGTPQLMSSYDFSDTDAGPPSDASGNTNHIYDSPLDDTPNCFGEWKCEHRWRPIGNMVAFRNAVGSGALNNWWDNGGNQIAFGRGTSGFVVINRDESSSINRTFHTSLPSGTYCDVIAGDFSGGSCSGRTLTVNASGDVTITLPVGSAAALHSGARVSGPSSVSTTFNETNASTWFGQNVYVVGNVPALGGWDPAQALPLSWVSSGTWRVSNVALPASTAIRYKYIKKPGNNGQAVAWESDPDRTFTTPASGTATRNDSWR